MHITVGPELPEAMIGHLAIGGDAPVWSAEDPGVCLRIEPTPALLNILGYVGGDGCFAVRRIEGGYQVADRLRVLLRGRASCKAFHVYCGHTLPHFIRLCWTRTGMAAASHVANRMPLPADWARLTLCWWIHQRAALLAATRGTRARRPSRVPWSGRACA